MWVVCIVAAWAAMVGAALAFGHYSACLFKRVTGLPCLTCGSTRAALALMRGDVVQAWLLNPLVMTAGVVLLAIVSMRVFAGRRLELGLSRPQRAVAWLIAAAAIGGNWVYVALVVG